MNKNKILKIITLVITFALIACISTSVFADSEPDDLTQSLTGGNTTTTPEDITTEDATTDGTTTEDATTEDATTGDATTQDPVPDITPKPVEPNTNTNTNASTYEESDIPYAGPEDTILMVSAFTILLIIGIYTFVKMSEYSNL